MIRYFLLMACIICANVLIAQSSLQWSKDGKGYYAIESGDIHYFSLADNKATPFLEKDQLVPQGSSTPIAIRSFQFSRDMQKVLIFTNSKKVWRFQTRGDYYIYDLTAKTLVKAGASLPASSLMFAKFSPDGKKLAYVSSNNIYVEDIASAKITQLTNDGSRKLINGTFDWAYEEEFFCRDGFRWAPDSKQIAFWQIDASLTRDYLMINNTDSIYPVAVPVEYPIAGELPSPFRIGVTKIESADTRWMNIPYDKQMGTYAPRMEWAANPDELIVQVLDRKQQVSKLMICTASSGAAKQIYEEKDSAWIDILPSWDQDYANGGWDWLNTGKEFMWVSEKDGWRHLYRVSRDGKKESLISHGNFDVMDITAVDETGNYVYYMASPDNATQNYLYRSRLDGKGNAERMSPAGQTGTHDYEISPGAVYAKHGFSNHYTEPVKEWITLKDHKALKGTSAIEAAIAKSNKSSAQIQFFKVTTSEGVTMDAWIAKPVGFDSTKKYPVVFYVYTEPWGQTVADVYGTGTNHLYNGDMLQDGYIYISIDNRGTPVAKGREWRKSVYRKIGLVNIRDQALAATEILKRPYIDTSRVAVWGWSGGGSATLNLMFQYPEIYKTGISIAAVGNQRTYDNIYQERYMGLPQENPDDFVKGSPITYAKNLKGNLLYIHGTGDDNVHYNNAEMLFNELIRYNKQFQMMSYPNRTHSISEGAGTFQHLSDLYTAYLKRNCPPGAR
jgi:dipeptidyl-peptidase-4